MSTTPIQKASSSISPQAKRVIRSIVIAVLLIVFGWIFFRTAFVSVNPGEILVRQNNIAGGITERDFGPGHHLRLPGIHRAYLLDARYFMVNFSNTDDYGEEYPPLSLRVGGDNRVTVDVSIPLRILPGQGHLVVDEGLHVGDSYKSRAIDTIRGTLRTSFASLTSEDWYNVERRQAAADGALEALNSELEKFRLEADRVFIRFFYFRPEYEERLVRIQMLQQEGLLNDALERLSNKRQRLDNYQQETEAMANARAAWWDRRIAVIEDGFRTGLNDTSREPFFEALTEVGLVNLANELRGVDPGSAQYLQVIERIRGELETQFADPRYELGIEGINALANREVAELEAQASSVVTRYEAEAEQIITEIEADRERRINELLSSVGGRAYVALQAAQGLQLDTSMTFPADTMPWLLDLGGIADRLMGR